MKILLHHCRVSLTSGTGQLMRMQAAALRAAGERVTVICRRGALKFFLRTGLPVRPVTAAGARRLSRRSDLLTVDHAMRLPDAPLVFVHNLISEARRYLDRPELAAAAAREAEFFAALRGDARVVANSRLVAAALASHFNIREERLVTRYPGIQSARFTPAARRALRAGARASLGLDEGATPLAGFVTSGDFHKRGLDLFLQSATQLLHARPDMRFLVVGSRRLPVWAAEHPLLRRGRVLYRPKDARPERWLSALDLFLYTARFEEFGMVVAEALATGLPVLTSRRVGAAECLPEAYAPWIAEAPDPEWFAHRASELLESPGASAALSRAGVEAAAALEQSRYVQATLATIRDQKR